MAKRLTLQQIQALTAQARALGLSPAGVEGVRAALLMRTASLDLATKLDMAITLLPDGARGASRAFVGQVADLSATRLASGRALLEALPDAEWDAIFDEQDEGEGA